MKKLILPVTLFLLLGLALSFIPKQEPVAQFSSPLVEEELIIDNFSSYAGRGLPRKVIVIKKKTRYDTLIANTFSRIGLFDSDIKIRRIRTYGAFSAISSDCRNRYLLYNKQFLDSVYAVTGSLNAVKSIFLHELGHHAHRHPLKSKKHALSNEKQADKYSGFYLYIIGASLAECTAAMEHFGSNTSTGSHPDKISRINEIKAGYYEAMNRNNPSAAVEKNLSAIYDEEKFKSFEKLINSKKGLRALDLANMKNAKHEDIIDKLSFPTYSIQGELLMIDETGNVIDIINDHNIGKELHTDLKQPFKLLQLENTSLQLEGETIYSVDPIGTKLEVGFKIN